MKITTRYPNAWIPTLARLETRCDRSSFWKSSSNAIFFFLFTSKVTRTGLRDVRERAVDAGAARPDAAPPPPPPPSSQSPPSPSSGSTRGQQERGPPLVPEHRVHRKRRGTGRADVEQRAEQRLLQRPELEFGESTDATGGRASLGSEHESPQSEPAGGWWGPGNASVSIGGDKRDLGTLRLYLEPNFFETIGASEFSSYLSLYPSRARAIEKKKKKKKTERAMMTIPTTQDITRVKKQMSSIRD